MASLRCTLLPPLTAFWCALQAEKEPGYCYELWQGGYKKCAVNTEYRVPFGLGLVRGSAQKAGRPYSVRNTPYTQGICDVGGANKRWYREGFASKTATVVRMPFYPVDKDYSAAN